MPLNPKTVFFIDALGALLSAFFLGVVLTRFEALFGMPKGILFWLASIALCFAAYSFLNFLRMRKNWPAFLRGIAVANLTYCVLTVGLVIRFWQSLTPLGLAYFLSEVAIVCWVVTIELKTAYANKQISLQ